MAYIEIIRGSPLIALLFMGMVLLPLFLPPDLARPFVVGACLGGDYAL